jgi:hypothetical protein
MPMPDAETAITAAFLIGGLSVTAVMAWTERRPRKGFETRLLPTTPFLFLGILTAILALVHLLNLWGIHTGRN